MKRGLYSILLLLLLLLLPLGCTEPSPSQESEPPKLTVTGFEPHTANSGEFVRISGSGFDTNVVIRLGDMTIPIDTLSPKEIVIRAPWPRGDYTLKVGPWNNSMTAPGELSITHRTLTPLQMEEGWYRVISMKATGVGSATGWRVWNSAGQVETYSSTFNEDTTGETDYFPWVHIVHDSIIGGNGYDADYTGLINSSSAQITKFRGELIKGTRSTGFVTRFVLAANELEISGSNGKYFFRSSGLRSFDTLRGDQSTGNPRPSYSTWSFSTTPNSFVEVALEKDH